MKDTFGARSTLTVGGKDYEIFRLDAVEAGHVAKLPYSLKILLENLLRHEDGRDVTRDDILALAHWDPKADPSTEISFTPARVVLQDFTGVPAIVDLAAMRDADWEIASHGYRCIDYQHVDEETEREHLRKAIEIHERATGARPLGWYLGRCSPNTHRLVAEEGGFAYNADSYADDLPYWDRSFQTPQLMLPYTLDANDMRFATAQGFNTGKQFYRYLKDTFRTLHAEGGRMMSIGLHCRLAGRPGRAAAVARFLDKLAEYDDVWITTRLDIARHWREAHPPGDERG